MIPLKEVCMHSFIITLESFRIWIIYLLSKPAAPGWMQAIGAIIALVVAVWVPNRQANKTRKERRESMLAVAEAAQEYARRIRDVVNESDFSIPQLSPRIYEVYDASVIRGVVRALRAIPVHDLGSRNAVIAILSLTDQMVFLEKAMQKFIAGPQKHPELSVAIDCFEPEDIVQRKKCYLGGFEVLAKNIRTHLDKIEKDYGDLMMAMRSLKVVRHLFIWSTGYVFRR